MKEPVGLLDWVKEFKKHYKEHRVDYSITSDGTRVVIEIELKDIPEERVRNIVEKLDSAIAQLGRGKLPLPAPSTPIKENVKKIKEKIKPRHKTMNPLVTGVVASA